MILAGNVALESMGFKTFGFGGGREDIWEPEQDIYWGSEEKWLETSATPATVILKILSLPCRWDLIYVNPEGPNGNPDPIAAARDIRETFARMAMNDEETVALIAGGHTFGKTHGAGPASNVGRPEPEGAPIEEQGLGWTNSFGTGKGVTRSPVVSKAPGSQTPTKWDNGYLRHAVWLRVGTCQKPGRRTTVDSEGNVKPEHMMPDAHDPSKNIRPMMTTATSRCGSILIYEKISRRFMEHPDQFADAFARAWFKLTHRDMGPRARYLGPEVPKEELIWQDPIPKVNHKLIDAKDIASLKRKILASGLSVSELVSTAWASASTFRGSDKRGGANGARIRLAPQKDWEVNQPAQLAKVLKTLEGIQSAFNKAKSRGKKVSSGRPDRSGRLRGHREGCEECRSQSDGSIHARTHGRLAGANRCGIIRRARAEGGWFPQLPQDQICCIGRGNAGRQSTIANPDRA